MSDPNYVSVPKGRYIKHVEPVAGSKYVKRVEPIAGAQSPGLDPDNPNEDLVTIIEEIVDNKLEEFEVETPDVLTQGEFDDVSLPNQYEINTYFKDRIEGLGDEFGWVTDTEFEVDQKRQDEALAEEITAREERDLVHDAQLNTIEYKLDALIGLQFQGVYKFKHEVDCDANYLSCIQACSGDVTCQQACVRDLIDCEADHVQPGYFEAVDPDDQFDHLERIVISKSDVDGTEIDWSGVLDEGDYLEVDHVLGSSLDKRNYGLYRITEEPELTTNSSGEPVYIMQLQFLQGDGEMLEGENYEIRGITAAEGVNPEELGDFLTKEEAANLYSLKTHTHAWDEITDKPGTYKPSGHYHNAQNINSGVLAIQRIPTGTASDEVALGNHTHSNYATKTYVDNLFDFSQYTELS